MFASVLKSQNVSTVGTRSYLEAIAASLHKQGGPVTLSVHVAGAAWVSVELEANGRVAEFGAVPVEVTL